MWILSYRGIAVGILALIGFAVAIVLTLAINQNISRLGSWLFLIAVITLMAFFIGWGILKSWKGIFVDQRNRVSLARFQVVIWTILVLATFAEAALANIAFSEPNPVFTVVIPSNLWLVMGISIAALPVAAAASARKSSASPDKIANAIGLRTLKDQETVTDLKKADSDTDVLTKGLNDVIDTKLPTGLLEKDTTIRQLPKVNYLTINGEDLIANGLMVSRAKSELAKFKDMFVGDEITNFNYVDISKVQLFLFNVVLIIVFSVALAYYFMGQPPFASLPNIPDLVAVFLGISNGAYILFKATPRTA